MGFSESTSAVEGSEMWEGSGHKPSEHWALCAEERCHRLKGWSILQTQESKPMKWILQRRRNGRPRSASSCGEKESRKQEGPTQGINYKPDKVSNLCWIAPPSYCKDISEKWAAFSGGRWIGDDIRLRPFAHLHFELGGLVMILVAFLLVFKRQNDSIAQELSEIAEEGLSISESDSEDDILSDFDYEDREAGSSSTQESSSTTSGLCSEKSQPLSYVSISYIHPVIVCGVVASKSKMLHGAMKVISSFLSSPLAFYRKVISQGGAGATVMLIDLGTRYNGVAELALDNVATGEDPHCEGISALDREKFPAKLMSDKIRDIYFTRIPLSRFNEAGTTERAKNILGFGARLVPDLTPEEKMALDMKSAALIGKDFFYFVRNKIV
ncbi:hypothetical protein EZV62_011520 [Acer yangbiense]|uniref:Uncharacterized protein n=1 Tax=Acer yangbiense TaxID=1000413 RepID=A0A5C7I7V9_9ROSI|nr:hypothetical protein EZV62_011520 [Acer yangbiense]